VTGRASGTTRRFCGRCRPTGAAGGNQPVLTLKTPAMVSTYNQDIPRYEPTGDTGGSSCSATCPHRSCDPSCRIRCHDLRRHHAAAAQTTHPDGTDTRRPFYCPPVWTGAGVSQDVRHGDRPGRLHGASTAGHLPSADIVQPRRSASDRPTGPGCWWPRRSWRASSEHHLPSRNHFPVAEPSSVLNETTQPHAHGSGDYYYTSTGNYTSVTNVAFRINRDTAALAIDLGRGGIPRAGPKSPRLKGDSHAGVEETSMLLRRRRTGRWTGRPTKTSLPPLAAEIMAKADSTSKGALLDAPCSSRSGPGNSPPPGN
jgi:hypothetical protein